jgi:Ca-activated chloride channel family protein
MPTQFRDLPMTGGMLVPSAPNLSPVPLKHTDVQIAVVGPIYVATLRQHFHNSHTAPLEATYVFPLPADAAVTMLEVQLPQRVIRGSVEERDQAQQRFREAADRGQGAALLEQERANLFTLSLANVQPGDDIEVLLCFHARVPYDDERYRLSFPTVVLPRYLPADHDTEDAVRVGNTPLLPEDSREGHTISLSVQLDAGKLSELRSPSHAIDVEQGRGSTQIRLRNEGEIPNRDFVLSYRTASAQDEAALYSYRAAGQLGTLLLTLTPRLSPPPQALMARELLFVFDRSGSMGGSSIEQARNALHACLRTLNPGDVFNIFPFDNVVEQFAPQPVAFTQENIDRADAFIERINARGGTEILGAIRAALQQPRDSERLRIIVFLTDGAVGNEEQVLRGEPIPARSTGRRRAWQCGVHRAKRADRRCRAALPEPRRLPAASRSGAGMAGGDGKRDQPGAAARSVRRAAAAGTGTLCGDRRQETGERRQRGKRLCGGAGDTAWTQYERRVVAVAGRRVARGDAGSPRLGGTGSDLGAEQDRGFAARAASPWCIGP